MHGAFYREREREREGSLNHTKLYFIGVTSLLGHAWLVFLIFYILVIQFKIKKEQMELAQRLDQKKRKKKKKTKTALKKTI